MSVRYVLAPEAAVDLGQIWGYIKQKADIEIADRVEAVILQKIDYLARNPGSGHSRNDLTDEPVRFFPVYSNSSKIEKQGIGIRTVTAVLKKFDRVARF